VTLLPAWSLLAPTSPADGHNTTPIRPVGAGDLTLLLPILALAFAVRAAGVNAESFSMDEVTDLEIAALPAGRIVALADGFPPLYHLILKGWLSLWGTPLAARWLSALLGLVTVYAVYRLALSIAGRPSAIAAGVLTAVSPMHVWFAQESRAYSLALPLAALTLWRYHRALSTNSTRDWLLYATAALAAVCTHYFLAIVVAVQALWVMPRVLDGSRNRGPMLTAYGALALLALPVLYLLRIDLAFQSGTGGESIGVGHLLYTLYVFLLGFSTGASLRELHEMGLRQAAAAFLPWILALAACLLPLGLLWAGRARQNARRYGSLLATAAGTVAAIVVLALVFDLKYKVSYVSWASIPLLVALGEVIGSGWSRWWVRPAAAAYGGLILISLGNRHLQDRYRNEDVRAAAAYLEAHASPRAPVFIAPVYMRNALVFYLGPGWRVETLPEGQAALGTIARLTHSPAAGATWLVYTRSFHGDPTGELRAGLASQHKIKVAANFPGVALYRLDQTGRDSARP
jgi:uncharacterized membrane protein